MPIMNTLAETLSAVITDDSFGERVILKPRANGRVDPSREERELFGPLRTGPTKDSNMTTGGGVQSWRTMLSAGSSELHLDQLRYPGLEIRSGDDIHAIERPGQPWFRVETFDDRGAPRLIVQLSEA